MGSLGLSLLYTCSKPVHLRQHVVDGYDAV